jgi:acylphosphatase
MIFAAHSMMTRRYIIHGRVQGVGFRYFVTRIADAFDIRGYVRNAPDGSVEIVASGERENMQGFREQVEIGPSGARVDRVSAEEMEERKFDGFRVAG